MLQFKFVLANLSPVILIRAPLKIIHINRIELTIETLFFEKEKHNPDSDYADEMMSKLD